MLSLFAGRGVHSVMRTRVTLVLALSLAAMGCSASSGQDGGVPGDGGADWVLSVDPQADAGTVGPALLGHYDLSGVLLDYGSNAAVKARMQAIGLSDWRVGVGRWEVSTRLLPTRTDGSSCATWVDPFPASLKAPAGATDLSLIADRDWFTDTGAPVTLADTAADDRYALSYVRSVIDLATAWGATPFVDIDLMPRALSRSRDFSRVGMTVGLLDPCMGTFSNGVSNAPPADPAVFAAAARGLVQRVVEGSGTEAGRDAPYWEIWNEHELGYAWTGTNDDYFATALTTLVELDAYRAASSAPRVKALRFGFGSFARSSTAAGVLAALDATALPNGQFAPFDFLSFHAYDNDPLVIVSQLAEVATARAATQHYRDVELVLSEWGPNLGTPPPSASMDQPLLIATVLARAPAYGITRTHHSILFDFAPPIEVAFAPLGADGTPKPLYRAYELLHALVGDGGERLPVSGATDGALSGGKGAVLVLKPASGGLRALLVNRDSVAHRARLEAGGAVVTPSRVRVFDAPAQPPRDAAVGRVVEVPARSIVLVEQ